jgi:hypothetical protein
MSGFTNAWLGLREPLDAASRDVALVGDLLLAAPHRPIVVTDLAAGTGANLRYLAPRLGGEQHWRLIDHDDALLAIVPARLDAWAQSIDATVRRDGVRLIVAGQSFECRVDRVSTDLSDDLESLDIEPKSLVATSALLDLVSKSWLEVLAQRCRQADATALVALTYDGRVEFDPPDVDDAWVVDLVNRHQRTDKGFGPALGPDAAEHAAHVFRHLGFDVTTARSDWQVDDRHRELQQSLLGDWAAAARELAPEQTPSIERWAARRARAAEAGARLVVGHVDLLARSPAP